MSKNTGAGTSDTDPLAKSSDDSRDGSPVRNYDSNPDAPTMKNGKPFRGAYGG